MDTTKQIRLGVIAFGKIKQFEKRLKLIEDQIENICKFLDCKNALKD